MTKQTVKNFLYRSLLKTAAVIGSFAIWGGVSLGILAAVAGNPLGLILMGFDGLTLVAGAYVAGGLAAMAAVAVVGPRIEKFGRVQTPPVAMPEQPSACPETALSEYFSGPCKKTELSKNHPPTSSSARPSL